jgi:hypothetical protein
MDSGLLEPDSHSESAEAAADDDDVLVVLDRESSAYVSWAASR